MSAFSITKYETPLELFSSPNGIVECIAADDMVVGESYVVEFDIVMGGGGPMPDPEDHDRKQVFGQCIQYPGEDFKRIEYTATRYIRRVSNPSPPWEPYDPRIQLSMNNRRTSGFPIEWHLMFAQNGTIPEQLKTIRIDPNPLPNSEPYGTNVYKITEKSEIQAQREKNAVARIDRTIKTPFIERINRPYGPLYEKRKRSFDARNGLGGLKRTRRMRHKRISRKRKGKGKRSSKKQ